MESDSTGTLRQRLLDDNIDTVHSITSNNHDFNSNNDDDVDDDDIKKGRIYANNKPKIVLEILSARTAVIILVLTYVIFIVGFVIDAVTINNGFKNFNSYLPSTLCNSIDPPISTQGIDTACLSGNIWNGSVVNLNNVISVQLNVKQYNFSGLFDSETTASSVTLYFDVMLYGCFQSGGCGSKFTNNPTNSKSDVWHQVMSLEKQSITVFSKQIGEKDYVNNGLDMQIFDNTFQNQETTPDNGIVDSYFVKVEYYPTPETTNLLVSSDENILDSITYTFYVISRPLHSGARVVVVFLLMCITIFLGVYFISSLNKLSGHLSNWLPEQKWVVAYLIVLFIYQNIVYCSIFWQRQPTFGAVYVSYIFDGLGQAGLISVWLIFSDSLRRQSLKKFMFYVPKIVFGLIIFIVGMVVLTYQFPNVVPGTSSSRSSVEAVVNWPHSTERTFIVFSMMYVVLLWIFVLRWFHLLWNTGRNLRRLPYMSTRYLQLSYRFFLLQATLVTIFYVFEYGYVLYRIAANTTNYHPTNTTLANDINTLLREQTQMFGKLLFLSVYAIILTIIFLPASVVDSYEGITANLASTYVITMEELKPLVRSRRAAIHKLNSLQQSLYQQIASYKEEVFCADLALTMCNLSYEAYYDIENKPTASGFGHSEQTERNLNIAKYGYSVVDSIYNEDHDTFCCIARHDATQHLVVMFRGSSSKKHWKDNLNYAKIEVEFDALTLPELDKEDGLDTPDERGQSTQTLMRRLASLSTFVTNAYGGKRDDVDSDDDSGDDETPQEDDKTPRRDSFRQDGSVMKSVLDNVVDATTTVVGGIGATTNIVGAQMATAAAATPVLKSYVKPFIHSGFWAAYSVVREFVHTTLRRELLAHPGHVYFTGHSLGGALATLAAHDACTHTIPRVNGYLSHSRLANASRDAARAAEEGFIPTPKVRKVRTTLYNFGSPKVGNTSFVQGFNKLIPDTFRVVVDGDVVTGVPPGYAHVGTEVLVDDSCSGSIIVDPSFVERWLRTNYKTSVASHSLVVYRDALAGVIDAANFMKKFAPCATDDVVQVNQIKLALQTRALLQEGRLQSTLRVSGSESSKEKTSSLDIGIDIATDNSRGSGVLSKTEVDDAQHFAAEYEQHAGFFDTAVASTSSRSLLPTLPSMTSLASAIPSPFGTTASSNVPVASTTQPAHWSSKTSSARSLNISTRSSRDDASINSDFADPELRETITLLQS